MIGESKIVSLSLLFAFIGLMLYAVTGLPGRGDLDADYNQKVSVVGSKNAGVYYIENAYKDAHTDNMVSVVLADYRGFDTLGETVVVFTAGIIVILIMRRRMQPDIKTDETNE